MLHQKYTHWILLLRIARVAGQVCPNLCSGHGDCQLNTGECSCYEQFTGADCSKRSLLTLTQAFVTPRSHVFFREHCIFALIPACIYARHLLRKLRAYACTLTRTLALTLILTQGHVLMALPWIPKPAKLSPTHHAQIAVRIGVLCRH